MSRWSAKFSVVVLACPWTWILSAKASAEVISVTVPFVSPKGSYVTQPDRYHTFRIPGMTIAPDGSVLLFAEGRRGDGSDPRRDKNAPIDVVMRRSTDNGRTWQVGNVTPGPDASESEVVELTDGRVLLDARQNNGDFRRRHLSTDGGVTWGPDNSASVPLTPVDGSLVRYSAKRAGHDLDRILFSGSRGEGGLNRNNITVWTSYDEGSTFVNPVQFNSGFAAYSVVQRLSGRTIGLVVETASGAADRYGEITFYRFDVAELEAEVRSR